MREGDFTFEISEIFGLNAILDNFKQLPEDVQKKIGWKAGGSAMRIVRDAAIDNAKRIDKPPHFPGDIDSKIYPFIVMQRASRTARSQKAIAYRVGVRGQAIYDGTRVPPTYWRFVELGTSKTRAQPFLRPALEDNTRQVSTRLQNSLWEEIAKWADKNKVNGK